MMISASPLMRRSSVIVATSLVFSAVAFAIPPSARATPMAMTPVSSVEDFAKQARPLPTASAKSLSKATRLSERVRSGLTIDYSGVAAWQVGNSVFVELPLSGANVKLASVGALIGPDGHVRQRTELAMVGDERAGTVTMWVDGQKTVDQIVSSDSAASEERGFWSKLNSCLSNAGISSWVVTGVSIACAAVCVGTLGLGCVACIAAAAGIAGGVAGYCVDQAQK